MNINHILYLSGSVRSKFFYKYLSVLQNKKISIWSLTSMPAPVLLSMETINGQTIYPYVSIPILPLKLYDRKWNQGSPNKIVVRSSFSMMETR